MSDGRNFIDVTFVLAIASVALAVQSCRSMDVGPAPPWPGRSQASVRVPATAASPVAPRGARWPDGWKPLVEFRDSNKTGVADSWEESLFTAMALDEESVFIARENGDVLKVPKVGGVPIRLVTGPATHASATTALKVDATHVYWLERSWVADTSHGIVKRIVKTGGSIELIEDALGGAFGAALGPAEVYYLDPDFYSASTPTLRVRKVPKAGGEERSFSLPEHSANGMVTDGGALFVAAYFWGQPEGEPWRIFRLDPRTSKFSRLGFGGSQAMAVDQTHLYWADDSGAVFRMIKGGGVAEKLWTGPIGAVDLVVDETTIYWTTRWSSTQMSVSNVMKVPKAGGEAVILADWGGGMDFRIAVDAHSIYWMTPGAVLVHSK